MGGRGSSSGISASGNPYGSQYHTVLENGNIKFVAKNIRQSETLMETMTAGRIYVETGGDDLLRIVFFDEDNKRNHVIERDKRTDKWHAHNGYYHYENSASQHDPLNAYDKILLAEVKKIWYSRKRV